MKKIYVDLFVYLQKAPITASSDNVPYAPSSVHGQKYYNFCQIKNFKCSYSKVYT